MIVLAIFVAAILALLLPRVQRQAARLLHNRPPLLWIAPLSLTAIFCAVAAHQRAFSFQLCALVLVYTLAPTCCVFLQGPSRKPGWLDFVAVLLLWLPLEFAAGAQWIPRQAQGYLHSVAYGVAILLGLILFLCFRSLSGMKYNPPRAARDLWLALGGFAVTAPVLIWIGVWIGFIPPFHWSTVAASRMALAFPVVFLGTALPEEILFRSLIQNLLMQRLGPGLWTLVLASIIFGAAHLDNGPQPAPNWRYFILASVAGFAYGRVFERSSTILSSVLFHTLVDWTKHYYF